MEPGLALIHDLHPELATMLGEERTKKLASLMPKVREALQRGNPAKASQYLLREMKLGPKHVGQLLAAVAKRL